MTNIKTLSEAKERFVSRRFGVFSHYLYGTPSGANPEMASKLDWNVRCEGFDTERVAYDLHSIGAGYYFITLMQGRKYMLAPNAAFDRIAGTQPGEACAKRDVAADLIKSLSKYDIDLYLYYTGDGPYKDPEVGEKFGFLEPRKNVSLAFAEKWAEVLGEYAERYGDGVKGWWIDGCYDYFDYNDEKLKPYFDAVRRGNPTALVTFNNGVKDDLYNWYKDEDFTSGEFNDFTCIPKAKRIGNSIPHILAPLGISKNGTPYGAWAMPGCKHDGAFMRDYVRKVNDMGGVVSIDIRIEADSTFDRAQLDCLRKINT